MRSILKSYTAHFQVMHHSCWKGSAWSTCVAVAASHVGVHGLLCRGGRRETENVAQQAPPQAGDGVADGLRLAALVEGIVRDALWIFDIEEGAKLTAMESVHSVLFCLSKTPGAAVVG